MNFKKLDINGFKSFFERTTFLIEDGLTGIVGPNGCGKSNIVEALRWCMGETSAKSMRGIGIINFIFAESITHRHPAVEHKASWRICSFILPTEKVIHYEMRVKFLCLN